MKDLKTFQGSAPKFTFTELMILAKMATLEEVIPFLDEDDLEKYGMLEKEDDFGEENTPFTKSMLKDGMFVRVAEDYYMVMGNVLADNDLYLPLKDYKEDLKDFRGDPCLTIDEVFVTDPDDRLAPLKYFLNGDGLKSIWKRPDEKKILLQKEISEMEQLLLEKRSLLEGM